MSDLRVRMTALVTGASRGIGRAIARSLAARGVRVALHYHTNEAAAHEARAQLAGDGHLLCSADLGDAAATARLWRDVVLALGRVDVLVNNAGIFFDHPPLATDFAAWEAAGSSTFQRGARSAGSPIRPPTARAKRVSTL